MPWWVLNLTTFPSFNLGFSVFFWMMVFIIPVLIIAFFIRNI